MPSKKKKYNARFPAGRIKKIMQSDEEIGKVAQAVPVIISRTLELFVESLLTKTLRITNARSAKTLSPSHMKQCIMSEQRFDFLKELVRNIPDISVAEEAAFNYNDDDVQSSEEPDSDTPYDLSLPSTSIAQRAANGSRSANINSDSNNTAIFARSVSLNGGGLKRTLNPSTHTTVIMQTAAALAQLQQHQGHPLPMKLGRSESTPAYNAPRGRPPNISVSINNTNKSSSSSSSISSISNRLQKIQHTPETAIPAPICSYDMLSKPIVKIDYSNVQMLQTNIDSYSCDTGTTSSSTSNSAFNFDIAAPVINIDLTNIVAASSPAGLTKPTTTTPTPAKICYGGKNNNNNNNSSNNNNSVAKLSTSSVNCIAGKSKIPIIPKAPAASAPTYTTKTNTLFELDEDYDNI